LSELKPVFNLIVANITHDILAGLAPALAGLVKPRGFLVLSGILKGEQESSLKEIYADQDLVLRKTLEKDEWAAMQFQKK
ncbi:MAG: 50S ribosomal protein L11 methyltransferase, partial [Desulfobulbales bacterium]